LGGVVLVVVVVVVVVVVGWYNIDGSACKFGEVERHWQEFSVHVRGSEDWF
jgi:type II secretory pathway component PulK